MLELEPISKGEDAPLLARDDGEQDKHQISFVRTPPRSIFEACWSERVNQEIIVGGFERKQLKSILKSVPPYAAYTRYGKDRSLGLSRITTFRHWWKQSRLLCRLAGLYVYAIDESRWDDIVGFNLIRKKGPKQALKVVKRLSQGGPLRPFMTNIKMFNGTVRIVVATWRFIEAAECRRFEAGVTELMAFCGNRVSRALARDLMDWFTTVVVVPTVVDMIESGLLGKHEWHPEVVLITLGVLRAIGPYFFSFRGSWFGRILTRATFHAAEDRWLNTMRVSDVNTNSQECLEWDEDSALFKNNDLVELAKFAATCLGKESDPMLINKHMKSQGFRQVGCGSGGYAVYHYRSGEVSVLLHATPYGPSIYDEIPKYIVLEHAESQDTRGVWSQYLSQLIYPGPPVVEGYCFKGAFFNSFQYASLREKYDSELSAYDRACKLMNSMNPSSQNPPTDLLSLKAFLETGRTEKQKEKRAAKFRYQEAVVARLVKVIRAKIGQMGGGAGGSGVITSKAPVGIILYLDGLDCVGKSSTSTKVQAALEQAGYKVTMCRYNKPPTAEEKKRPWMERFDRPGASTSTPTVSAAPSPGGDQSPVSYQHQHQHECSESTTGAHLKAYVWVRYLFPSLFNCGCVDI